MVKKILLIILLLVVMVGCCLKVYASIVEDSFQAKARQYWEERVEKFNDKHDIEQLRIFVTYHISRISSIIICSALIVLCGFAIYELIRSIRHPIRYAVEGAQQNYADYKAWREAMRAEREASQRAARKAELERQLAELEKTE